MISTKYYFCRKCQRRHFSGTQFYRGHQKYDLDLAFPDLLDKVTTNPKHRPVSNDNVMTSNEQGNASTYAQGVLI